jgi:hypothetical protein
MPSRMRARFVRSLYDPDDPRTKISPALRAQLEDLLRDDVIRLRDVYGVDIAGWGAY